MSCQLKSTNVIEFFDNKKSIKNTKKAKLDKCQALSSRVFLCSNRGKAAKINLFLTPMKIKKSHNPGEEIRIPRRVIMLMAHNYKNEVTFAFKDVTFLDLMQECKHGPPSAKLSSSIRLRLEKLPREIRFEIVSKVKDGCAPLFVACKRGQTEIVEYLLKICNADVEQRGYYEVPDERTVHYVTPLWCAAVLGRLQIIQILIDYGADINAVSDTGSTPVRSACFMTHLDIVQFLVEKGADIQIANYNGGTCLINSVQSVHLCRFLLKHGADVNARDIQNKTALHYAIQEHRLETTKLLLEYGADHLAKSRYNDDALQMACLKGAAHIFKHLTTEIQYSAERLANAYELIGATFVDEHNETIKALEYWKVAAQIRANDPKLLPKQPVIPPRSTFLFQREFETLEDLEDISSDLDAIRNQSLLICERVLGCFHKDALFRLTFRGAACADALKYQRCIDLWKRALEIRIQKDSLLYGDTCFTAQALVRLMIDVNEGRLVELTESNHLFQDSVDTFILLTKDLMETRQYLKIRPVFKRQLEGFDRILKCIAHLIYLMVSTATTVENVQTVVVLVKNLIKENPRSASTDDSLLHLCVSKLNTIKSSYSAEMTIEIFPNIPVIKLLLECGAPVNARNESRSTPLHIATNDYNFDSELIKLLLDNGAHLDTPNRTGNIPANVISANFLNRINLVNYLSLKCLAASVIVKKKIPYINQIPKTLEEFVAYHESQ